MGKLVVISGPSGAGKSTIVREVLRRTRAQFSVSVTTRRKRTQERQGRDYDFVDRDRFREMIERGELLEWAEVFGERYGTPAEPVRQALAAGQTILLDIDVQGALQVHRKMPDATFVLIVPPPGRQEELARRLRVRRSETESELAERLSKARKEIEAAKASGVYNHCVVNDDLQQAVREVADIVKQEQSKR